MHGLIGPNPGTRELVLFLAKNKPRTSTPKALKRGWEAIGRIFYGFMNTDRFTKTVVPDTDGSKFKDSTKHHSFIGRAPNAQVFEDGELQACHEFCPCSSCLLGRYLSCSLKAEMGIMVRFTCRFANHATDANFAVTAVCVAAWSQGAMGQWAAAAKA